MLIAWNMKQQRAAQLLADGELSPAQIAADVGVSPATLRTWRKYPAFSERVCELKETYMVELRSDGIASKQYRLDALDEALQKLKHIVAERAADPHMASVPGGRTGMLVRDEKVIGRGQHAQRIVEYSLDVRLLHAMLAIERQAAHEMGEWDVPFHRGTEGQRPWKSNVFIGEPGDEPWLKEDVPQT